MPPLISGVFSVFLMPFFLVRLNFREFFLTRWIFFMIAYLVVVGFFIIFQSNEYYLNRILAVIIYFGVVVNSVYLVSNKKNALQFSLKIVLAIHLLAFYFQLIFYYSGFGFFDFIFPFTGEEQRAFGGNYGIDFLGGKFIRPTGLYNEPGTYATTIILLFVLYESLVRLESKKINPLMQWLVVFSILLSFSIYGLIFLFIYMFSVIKLNKNFFMVSFLCFLFLFPFIWDAYLYPRFFSGDYADAGMGFRTEAIIKYLNLVDISLFNLFFGFGFFADLSEFFGEYVLNDVGLVFYILVVGGFIGLIIFLICVLYGSVVSNKTLTFIIIFSLSKISPSSIIFWFLLTIIVHLSCGKKVYFNDIDKL